MNTYNWFVDFFICRNTDEFCTQYCGLNNFSYLQVSVHPRKIPSHSSLISSKMTNFFIVKLLDSDFKMEQGFWYIPEPKILYIILWEEIILCTMGIL